MASQRALDVDSNKSLGLSRPPRRAGGPMARMDESLIEHKCGVWLFLIFDSAFIIAEAVFFLVFVYLPDKVDRCPPLPFHDSDRVGLSTRFDDEDWKQPREMGKETIDRACDWISDTARTIALVAHIIFFAGALLCQLAGHIGLCMEIIVALMAFPVADGVLRVVILIMWIAFFIVDAPLQLKIVPPVATCLYAVVYLGFVAWFWKYVLYPSDVM